MLIVESLWSQPVLVTASVVHVGALLAAIWHAPWRLVVAMPLRSHLIFGAVVALLILWRMNGPVATGVHLHLLGMTTATLLLGLPLAVITGTLTALGYAVFGGLPSSLVLAHALVNVLVPALVTTGLLHLVMRHGPRNLFIYMLGVGFIGGGLSMLAAVLMTMLLLAISGAGDVMREWMSPIMLLAMFPEGFLNGAVVSSLAVYRPDWLKTFDDHHFLDEN